MEVRQGRSNEIRKVGEVLHPCGHSIGIYSTRDWSEVKADALAATCPDCYPVVEV